MINPEDHRSWWRSRTPVRLPSVLEASSAPDPPPVLEAVPGPFPPALEAVREAHPPPVSEAILAPRPPMVGEAVLAPRPPAPVALGAVSDPCPPPRSYGSARNASNDDVAGE